MRLQHPLDREILALAVPALGALVAEPLFLATDTAFVGRLGADELAGLGIAGTVVNTAVGLLVFLAYATTPAVARRLGAGDEAGAVRAGVDGMWLAAGVGVLLALVGVPLAHPLAAAFGGTDAVTGHAASYLAIAVAGLPAMLVVFAGMGLFRGLQNTRVTLWISLAGFGANIPLNALFIFGFGWGIAGSAVGTVVAQSGMALACVVLAVRAARRTGASVRPGLGGVTASAISGGWLLLRSASLRVALIAVIVASTGAGTVTLAANQVLLTVYFLLALALDAFAIAAQAMIGHALGRGDRVLVRAVVRRLLGWGIGTSLVLAVPLAAASGVLGAVFTPDAAIRAALPGGLLVLAVSLPIGAVVFVLDGVLIGADDGRYLAITGVLNLAVFIPLLWAAVSVGSAGSAPAAVVAIQSAFCFGYLGARLVTLALRVRGMRWIDRALKITKR